MDLFFIVIHLIIIVFGSVLVGTTLATKRINRSIESAKGPRERAHLIKWSIVLGTGLSVWMTAVLGSTTIPHKHFLMLAYLTLWGFCHVIADRRQRQIHRKESGDPA